MGNINTVAQKAVSTVLLSAQNAVRTTQAIDQTQNINLDLSNTNCGQLSFINVAKAMSNINLSAIANNLAQQSTQLSDAQTLGLGLGFNVSATVAEREAIIKQHLENSCGSEQSIKQVLNIKVTGSYLNCDQLSAINNADLSTQCVVAAVMGAVTNENFIKASEQKNDILGPLVKLLSAPIMIIGAIILFFAGLVLLFRFFKKPAATTATTTEATIPLAATTGAEPATDFANAALAQYRTRQRK